MQLSSAQVIILSLLGVACATACAPQDLDSKGPAGDAHGDWGDEPRDSRGDGSDDGGAVPSDGDAGDGDDGNGEDDGVFADVVVAALVSSTAGCDVLGCEMTVFGKSHEQFHRLGINRGYSYGYPDGSLALASYTDVSLPPRWHHVLVDAESNVTGLEEGELR